MKSQTPKKNKFYESTHSNLQNGVINSIKKCCFYFSFKKKRNFCKISLFKNKIIEEFKNLKSTQVLSKPHKHFGFVSELYSDNPSPICFRNGPHCHETKTKSACS